MGAVMGKIEISMIIIGAALCLSSSVFSAELMEVDTPEEIAFQAMIKEACTKLQDANTIAEQDALKKEYEQEFEIPYICEY